MHPHPRKARAQWLGCAFSPGDCPPGMFWRSERQIPYALAPRIVSFRLAYFHRRGNGGHIGKPQPGDFAAQCEIVTIARIHEYDTGGHSRLESRSDLFERDLRLGLER